MNRAQRIAIVALATFLVLIGLFLIRDKVVGAGDRTDRVYASLCNEAGEPRITRRWNMLFYLDINTCLSCNEDLDAWRRLAVELERHEGRLLLWTNREDSADVGWAMELEGFFEPVRVVSREVVSELGWAELGTAVKILLDSTYHPVEIAGRMGNVRESRCFIEKVIERLESTVDKR